MSEPTTRAGRHAVRKYGLVDNEGTVLADPINDELVADVRAIEDEARDDMVPRAEYHRVVEKYLAARADLAKSIVERVRLHASESGDITVAVVLDIVREEASPPRPPSRPNPSRKQK